MTITAKGVRGVIVGVFTVVWTVGPASGAILSDVSGTREAGMAASVAVGNRYGSVGTNPALIADVRGAALTGTMARLIDESNVQRLEATVGTGVGSFGLSAGMFRTGSMDVVELAGVVGTVEAQQDEAFGLTYGRAVGAGLSVGAAVNYHRSTLVEQYTAQAVTFDAGVRWASGVNGLALGASVRGVGNGYRYAETTNDAPTVTAFGIAWGQEIRKGLNILAAGDIIQERGSAVRYLAGAEIEFFNGIKIRGGAKWDRWQTEFVGGVGVALRNFRFDYAVRRVSGDLALVPQASLTVRI